MGFDLNRFQGEVDEELLCPICSGVLEDARHAPQCEHAFCFDCIRQWIETQATCPVDRQPISLSELKPIPRILRNMIGRLEIACDNSDFGCTQAIRLDSLGTHQQACEYNPKRLVECAFGCACQIPADELKNHNCMKFMRELMDEQMSIIDEMRGNMQSMRAELVDHRGELRLLREWVMASRSDEDLCSRMDNESSPGDLLHGRHQLVISSSDVDADSLTANPYEYGDSRQQQLNRLPSTMRQHTSRSSTNPAGPGLPATTAGASAVLSNSADRLVTASNRRHLRDGMIERWTSSLPTARVTRWGGMISTPDHELRATIERSLIECRCPIFLVTDLMNNAHERRWPSGLVSLETRQMNRQQYEHYVCRRINPRHQAVVVMACDNAHMSDDMIREPGIVIIFAHGIESA